MAKFKRMIWLGDSQVANDPYEPDSKQQLLLAMLLWLRTFDRYDPCWLGLESMIELLVPFSKELKLGLNVPTLPAGKLITSAGDIYDIPSLTVGKFVYCSRSLAREFDLDTFGHVHISYRVHLSYLEWAFATALVLLDKSGKPWRRDGIKKPMTIGGMEVADFF